MCFGNRAHMYLWLYLMVFLSINYMVTGLVGECPSVEFSTLFPLEEDATVRDENSKSSQHLMTDVFPSQEEKTEDVVIPSNTQTRNAKTPKSSQTKKIGETVESAYFSGARIPVEVEKALASLLSQKEFKYVENQDMGKDPDNMKEVIGNFAKQFQEAKKDGPLLDETQMPQERATASAVDGTGVATAHHLPSKSTSGRNKNNQELRIDEKEKNPNSREHPNIQQNSRLTVSDESLLPLNAMVKASFTSKIVCPLLLILLLVLSISAVLFVYGPSDVLQWILSQFHSIFGFAFKIKNKGISVSQKDCSEVIGDEMENEKQHLHKSNGSSHGKMARLKSRDPSTSTNGKSSPSKKKTKTQHGPKITFSETNGTATHYKREKHKPKNAGGNNGKAGSNKTARLQEEQENDNDNNKWQEVTNKGKSGKLRPCSREDQDIFPCANRNGKLFTNPQDIPQPSTPNNPQTETVIGSPPSYPSSSKEQSETQEQIVEPVKINTHEQQSKTEKKIDGEIQASEGWKEANRLGLELTMNTSGAFTDEPGLDLSTPSGSGCSNDGGVHRTITTTATTRSENYSESKAYSPFVQSSHQLSPFALPMDPSPFTINTTISSNGGNLPIGLSSGLSGEVCSPNTPVVYPTVHQSSPTYFDISQKEARNCQSRIHCLLHNLRTKPFSRGTVSQSHQSMELPYKNNSEDAAFRATYRFGNLDGGSSLSSSGVLNNRLNSLHYHQLPHERIQQYGGNGSSNGLPMSMELNRRLSTGLPHGFPTPVRLGHRSGSLPLMQPGYRMNQQLHQPQKQQQNNLPFSLGQHHLSNDCSLFSSNPSIWSVDLAVDEDFVKSSMPGTRFPPTTAAVSVAGMSDVGKSQSIKGNMAQNIDFKNCLPDQLLSDTNAAG